MKSVRTLKTVRRPHVWAMLALLTVASAAPSFAQQQPADGSESVFAPYVSRLRVAFKDPKVLLTWQNPTDVSGLFQIYRSTQPITGATFSDARLVGTAKPGSESFLDVPDSPGNYFYAVLIQKPGDGTYQVFIPFRNVTLRPVKVAQTATQSELAASVSGIRAVEQDHSIVLTFQTSRPNRTIDLFRSTSPILSSDALAAATRVQQVDSAKTSVTDYPVPGIGYYYALVDSGLLTTGDVKLTGGTDATTTAVTLPLGTNQIGIPTQPIPPRRGTPLPYLVLTQDVQSGAALAPSLVAPSLPQSLSDQTKSAVTTLVDDITIPKPAALKPEILPEDRSAAAKGDAYTLKGILDTPFADRMWDRTAQLLTNFLSLSLPKDIEARAQFYLGQAYYFQGSYKPAFLAFLLARDNYYTSVQPWINSILLNQMN